MLGGGVPKITSGDCQREWLDQFPVIQVHNITCCIYWEDCGKIIARKSAFVTEKAQCIHITHIML